MENLWYNLFIKININKYKNKKIKKGFIEFEY